MTEMSWNSTSPSQMGNWLVIASLTGIKWVKEDTAIQALTPKLSQFNLYVIASWFPIISLHLRNCKLKLMASIMTAVKIPFTYLKCSAGKGSRMMPCAPGYSSSLMKFSFASRLRVYRHVAKLWALYPFQCVINLFPHQTARRALILNSQQVIFLAFKAIYDLADVLIVSLNLASQHRLCHRAGNESLQIFDSISFPICHIQLWSNLANFLWQLHPQMVLQHSVILPFLSWTMACRASSLLPPIWMEPDHPKPRRGRVWLCHLYNPGGSIWDCWNSSHE